MKKHGIYIVRIWMAAMLMLIVSGTAASAASKTAASIGKKKYASLEKAFNAVKKNQTIKLQNNITLAEPIVLKRNVSFTLDLNKHRIVSTAETEKGDIDIEKGALTVKNGTLKNVCLYVAGGAKLTVSKGTYSQVVNFGTTVIKDGTFSGSNAMIYNGAGRMSIKKAKLKAQRYGLIVEGGSVSVKSGTYSSTKQYPLVEVTKGKLTVYGGTFTAAKGVTLYNAGKGSVTLNGGRFTASSNGAAINHGKLTINKAVLKGTSKNYVTLQCEAGSTTAIKKGTVYSKRSNAVNIGVGFKKFTVSGGSVKSSAATCPAIWCCEKKSKKISIKSKYVTGKCKLKINYA